VRAAALGRRRLRECRRAQCHEYDDRQLDFHRCNESLSDSVRIPVPTEIRKCALSELLCMANDEQMWPHPMQSCVRLG
jgi:hypothetical protein